MDKKSEELRQFFESKGIRQEELAEQLGVDKAHVNKLLNGKKSFGKQTAKRWSDLFGLSYSYLLTGEGEMLASKKDERPVPAWMYADLLKERDEWRDQCLKLEEELANVTQRLSKYENIKKDAV